MDSSLRRRVFALTPDEQRLNAELGLGIVDPGQPLILYQDHRKASLEFTKRLRWLVLLDLALLMALELTTPSWLARIMLVALMLAIHGTACFAMRMKLKRTKKPILLMREDGISIATPFLEFPFIPWDEISDVQSERWPVRLKLSSRDFRKTFARGTRQTQVTCWIQALLSLMQCRSITIPGSCYHLVHRKLNSKSTVDAFVGTA